MLVKMVPENRITDQEIQKVFENHFQAPIPLSSPASSGDCQLGLRSMRPNTTQPDQAADRERTLPLIRVPSFDNFKIGRG